MNNKIQWPKLEANSHMHYINMKGDVKPVLKERAFDKNLQSQMNFFPCDENGVAVTQTPTATAPLVSEEVKKNPVAEVADVEKANADKIAQIASEKVEIVNPLEEASVTEEVPNVAEETQPQAPEVPVAQAKKKPGRKTKETATKP